MSALTTATGIGVRKAAILLIQMGRERAAAVLSHLTDAEVEAISGEIARLQTIDNSETDKVLTEFRDMMTARAHIAQGGLSFAQQLLEVLGCVAAADPGPQRQVGVLRHHPGQVDLEEPQVAHDVERVGRTVGAQQLRTEGDLSGLLP